jgi:hypothetical protein
VGCLLSWLKESPNGCLLSWLERRPNGRPTAQGHEASITGQAGIWGELGSLTLPEHWSYTNWPQIQALPFAGFVIQAIVFKFIFLVENVNMSGSNLEGYLVSIQGSVT